MEPATSSGGTPANCLVSETSAHPPPPAPIAPAAPASSPAPAPAPAPAPHLAQHSNYLSPPTARSLPSSTHPASVPGQQRHRYPNPPVPAATAPHTTNPMAPRSPPTPSGTIALGSGAAQMSRLSPKAGHHGGNYNTRKPRTVGAPATALGPRSSGVQKRGSGSGGGGGGGGGGGSGRTSALAAVLTLMPYHQYRARQRRDAAMGESVWDDELEAAFMEADASIPKIGRTKYNMDGKLRGRNELIAEFIFQRTGKRRTRKQVSSHIQVLKNLLKNNPGVAKDRLSDDNGDDDGDDDDDGDGDDVLDGHPPSESWSGDAQSPSVYSEPTPSIHVRTLPPGRPHSSMGYSHNDMPFASPPPSASNSQFGFSGARMELAAFVMALRSKTARAGAAGAGDSCFHTYSQLSRAESTHASPVSLSSLAAWRSRFPQVAHIVDEEAKAGAPGALVAGGDGCCRMLLMQTSIATMAAETPKQSLLCTQVELSLPEGEYDGCRWECITRVYASGNQVREMLHECQQVVGSNGQATQKIALPFASDFWGAFYGGLSAARSAGAGGDRAPHHHQQHHPYRQHPRSSTGDEGAAIQGITVVQELFSYPAQAMGAKHRSAVLMWEFAKAEAGSQGKAVWREVFRPQPPPLPLATAPATTPAPAVGQFGALHSINTSVANWGGGLCHQQPHQHHQPRLPISPYEELSPSSVHGLTYYPFDGPQVAYPSSPSPGNPRLGGVILHGSVPVIGVGGCMGMVYSQQDPHSFEAYSMTSMPTTKATTATAGHYLRGNNGGGGGGGGGGGAGGDSSSNNGGAMWEQQQQQQQQQHHHHHISPVSESHTPTVAEGGDMVIPY